MSLIRYKAKKVPSTHFYEADGYEIEHKDGELPIVASSSVPDKNQCADDNHLIISHAALPHTCLPSTHNSSQRLLSYPCNSARHKLLPRQPRGMQRPKFPLLYCCPRPAVCIPSGSGQLICVDAAGFPVNGGIPGNIPNGDGISSSKTTTSGTTGPIVVPTLPPVVVVPGNNGLGGESTTPLPLTVPIPLPKTTLDYTRPQK